jgi:hypothetical protein
MGYSLIISKAYYWIEDLRFLYGEQKRYDESYDLSKPISVKSKDQAARSEWYAEFREDLELFLHCCG